VQHTYETHIVCTWEPLGTCPICDGGLAVCTVCKAAEGELTAECPGEPVPYERREQVYAGILNFKNGQWITVNPQKAP
jgi:hypothetical protein